MIFDLIYRLRALFRKRVMEQELDDELRFHIENETQAQISRGIAPQQAARRARIALGGVEQSKEKCRDARGVSWLETALRDLRLAFRMLLKKPGFAAVGILTLALGIGANTAIFSAVKGILLRPLPYRDPHQLVMLWEANPHRDWTHNIVSAANFDDWKRRNHVFSDMEAFVQPTYTLTGEGEPVDIAGEQVTPGLFSLLGISPLYGRGFTEEEGRPRGLHAVLLGYAFWQSRFGGEKDIIGRGIALNGESYTVIGILPRKFDGCESCGGHRAQIWTSGLDVRPAGRTNHALRVVARLKPGISVDRAQAEMSRIAEVIGREDPKNSGWTVEVVGVRDDSVRVVRPAIVVLLGAVVLVLLITCVNLANILLARGASRQREVAIRSVLGAGHWRVVAQLLTENMLLAILGGGLGVVIAAIATRLFRTFAPAGVTPGLENIGLNAPVLAYGGGLVLLTALLFGLAPAILTARQGLNDSLKQNGRGTSGSAGHRIRGFLVAAEFALAMVLVTSASLMIVTAAKISRVRLGFDASNVLTMRIPLRGGLYRNQERAAALLETLVSRVEVIPEIEKASVSRGLPIEGWNGMDFVTDANPHPAPGEEPSANYLVVSPHYFNLMRIPLQQGRAFLESDTRSTAPVAIVNQALARELWSGADPLGRRIRMGANATDAPRWMTIVGIAKDVMTQGPEVDAHPEIYVPLAQYPWAITPRHLLVRMAPRANPAGIVAAIGKQLASLDPGQPLSDVVPLDLIAHQPLAVRGFLTWLLLAFGALALLLAGLGVYGVLSYAVTQRTQEIGIRVALGAEPIELLRHVIQQGVVLAVAGIAAGLVGALLMTEYLRSQLYGVGPRDPATFAIVPVILLAIGAAASYIPARRAIAVDPMIALRYE